MLQKKTNEKYPSSDPQHSSLHIIASILNVLVALHLSPRYTDSVNVMNSKYFIVLKQPDFQRPTVPLQMIIFLLKMIIFLLKMIILMQTFKKYNGPIHNSSFDTSKLKLIDYLLQNSISQGTLARDNGSKNRTIFAPKVSKEAP